MIPIDCSECFDSFPHGILGAGKPAKASIIASILGFLFFCGDVPTLSKNCDCISLGKYPNYFARIGFGESAMDDVSATP